MAIATTEAGVYSAHLMHKALIRHFFLCFCTLAISVVLAACGGGDSSDRAGSQGATPDSGVAAGAETTVTSGASAPLSRTEFVEEANAICVKGKQEGLEGVIAYAKEHGGESPQARLEVAAEALQKEFVPAVQKQVDEIRALGAPSGDTRQIEAFLSTTEKGVQVASKSKKASGHLGQTFALSAKLARKYGLDECIYGV